MSGNRPNKIGAPSITYAELTEKLDQVRLSFAKAFEELKSKYPQIDTATDARFTIISRSYLALTNAELGLAFLRFDLTKKDWWKMVNTKEMTEADISEQIKGFEMFIKIALIQFLFASIENAFRTYIREIFPKSCKNGTAEFQSIYVSLLGKLGLKKYISLLDLMRCVRNTIHNNGFYYHNSGRMEVLYNGRNYVFELGKPVDFVNWTFLFSLMPELLAMMVDVINSKVISSHAKIDDPFQLVM